LKGVVMGYIENLFNVRNKVVVVSGAMGQLGAEICKAFKDAGAKVIGLDIDTSGTKLDGADYFNLDITKKDKVLSVFKEIFGKNASFDILINNAGIGTFKSFEKRRDDEFDMVMNVNLKGTFFCIQSYANIFDAYKLKKGSIINIASIYGVNSSDFRIYTDCDRKNSEIYGATKAGIIQMTKYFAVHLADRNIRVNAVSPGGIYNPDKPQGEDFIKNYSVRCPMKRMANTEEILGAIIYLATDAASYTTGENILVDGGISCW
jgi:NAD(P)-dependent dehydrogenase (short-subunit alcohol dehydrogenase family)